MLMEHIEKLKINLLLPILLASRLDESIERARDIFSAAIEAPVEEPPAGKTLMVMHGFGGAIHRELMAIH